MSDNTKYYYLKLKDNFFNNKEIIILESMPNGYLYSLIYLKMLCRSTYHKRGFRKLINRFSISNTRYVSLIIREDEKDVEGAISTLTKMGLIEIKSGQINIKDINIDTERNRSTKQYKDWREGVFQRDSYTCQHCGEVGGRLNAHHILSWTHWPEKRFALRNGVTLCEDCHKKVHSKGD